jgi:glucokinase
MFSLPDILLMYNPSDCSCRSVKIRTKVLNRYWNTELQVPGQRKRTDKNVALALEIAGSGATIALIDSGGQVRHRLYAKTLWGRPAIATLQPYLRAVDAMFDYAFGEEFHIVGMGISIPGTLDQAACRPLAIPTLPAFNGFPLCELLEARYHVPIRLLADVDAAVLGEHRFGAGKGFRRLLFLTVNAVVGAALAVDGSIERTAQQYVGYMGHICHMLVSSSGPRCSCGKRGCINTLVSIGAIQRMVERAVRRGEQTSLIQRLSNRECFSPQLLAEEAMRGDTVALQVYSEVGRHLGAATARYISLFEPNMLILGGGVLNTSELLLAQVRSNLITHPSLKMGENVKIVPAHLGADAALIGAVVPLL